MHFPSVFLSSVIVLPNGTKNSISSWLAGALDVLCAVIYSSGSSLNEGNELLDRVIGLAFNHHKELQTNIAKLMGVVF